MTGPTGCARFISIVDSQERAKGRRTHGMVSAVAVAAVEGIELTATLIATQLRFYAKTIVMM